MGILLSGVVSVRSSNRQPIMPEKQTGVDDACVFDNVSLEIQTIQNVTLSTA